MLLPESVAPALGDLCNAADALASIAPGDLPDADRTSLTHTLFLLAEAQKALSGFRSDVEHALALLMESDKEVHDGYAVVRDRRRVTEWDHDRARSAIKSRIIQSVAIDPMTGEVHLPLRNAAERAMDAAMACFSAAKSAGLLVGGIKALGLEPGDYRTISDGSWTVKVSEAGE